jgi:MFS family permease
MIFKLHYFCLTAGTNALGILLGVYIGAYTDATPSEIGLLYMLMPFVGMTFRPIICSYADRKRAHRKYIMICLLVSALSYFPFVLIPFLGPEVHEQNPRFCWYFLVSFKVLGDIAFGGVVSIGDSLAINYAKRIGTEFSVYRVWGTVSWMFFGLVVGQLNEIWFLPKYVAGFMILVAASLVNMFVVYLWPSEYFVMVTPGAMQRENEERQQQCPVDGKSSSSMTRSLMPKEVVWAHAKSQLRRLVTCSCCSARKDVGNDLYESYLEQIKQARTRQQVAADPSADKETAIDKRTQLRTLALLLRRDPRIVPYLFLFVATGAAIVPISFFFMSLSDICHTDNRCNFSQLGGYLQVTMAIAETFLIIYIKRIIAAIGRLNTLSVAFGLTAIKYIFYGTLWPGVDPHYALLTELSHGVIWGIFLTLSVEVAHLFATEVEHIIPELMERGVIQADDETSREKLKLSLSATMQALIASASDGLGRGVGALVYGLIIDRFSFHTLWLIIGAGTLIVFLVLQLTNLADHCLKLELGLDVAAAKKREALQRELAERRNKLSLVLVESGPIFSSRAKQVDEQQQTAA